MIFSCSKKEPIECDPEDIESCIYQNFIDAGYYVEGRINGKRYEFVGAECNVSLIPDEEYFLFYFHQRGIVYYCESNLVVFFNKDEVYPKVRNYDFKDGSYELLFHICYGSLDVTGHPYLAEKSKIDLINFEITNISADSTFIEGNFEFYLEISEDVEMPNFDDPRKVHIQVNDFKMPINLKR